MKYFFRFLICSLAVTQSCNNSSDTAASAQDSAQTAVDSTTTSVGDGKMSVDSTAKAVDSSMKYDGRPNPLKKKGGQKADDEGTALQDSTAPSASDKKKKNP